MELHQTESGYEEDELVERKHRVSFEVAVRLRIAAIWVAGLSVVITLTQGIIALVVGIPAESDSSIAFGIESLLDCLSSTAVIWRYLGNGGNVYSPAREKIACGAIGVSFILSAIAVGGKAIHALVIFAIPTLGDMLWYMSIVNIFLCSILFISKFVLGYKLESKSLFTDGFNSLIGTILSAAILTSNIAYNVDSKYWYMDSMFSIICGSLLLIYGIKLLYDVITE